MQLTISQEYRVIQAGTELGVDRQGNPLATIWGPYIEIHVQAAQRVGNRDVTASEELA